MILSSLYSCRIYKIDLKTAKSIDIIMTTPLPETDMIDEEMMEQIEAEINAIVVPDDLVGEWHFDDEE